MQVQCRNKRLELSALHRLIVTQAAPRGTTAAPLAFDTGLHPCDIVREWVLLDTPFKRGFLTMRQGLGRNDTIQESGPPRFLFRGVVHHGTVSSPRAWRPYTSETGPGEGRMASSSFFSHATIPHPIGLIVCRESWNTLIFAQISTKISRLAGSWLLMPLTQSLAIELPLIVTRCPSSTELSMFLNQFGRPLTVRVPASVARTYGYVMPPPPWCWSGSRP